MKTYVVTATTRLDYEHGELVQSAKEARDDFIGFLEANGANPSQFEITVQVEACPTCDGEPYLVEREKGNAEIVEVHVPCPQCGEWNRE